MDDEGNLTIMFGAAGARIAKAIMTICWMLFFVFGVIVLCLRKNDGVPALARRRLVMPVAMGLQRQETNLAFVKRSEWTEDQIASLPADEHDYFERKGGALFDDPANRNALYDTLAKAALHFPILAEATSYWVSRMTGLLMACLS